MACSTFYRFSKTCYFKKHPLLLSAILTALGSTMLSQPLIAEALPQNIVTATQTKQTFSIPAGPLETALVTYSSHTNITVSFTPETVKGVTTQGAHGQYSTTGALAALMQGTGLLAQIQSNGSYTITRPDITGSNNITLPPVKVTGERIERALLDTASSVSVFNADTLEQHVTINTGNELLASVANVVGTETTNYAPAVRGIDGTGPARGGIAFFAGTRSRLGLLIDGRPAGFNELVFSDSSLWDVEQVEVFRGPQSTLNGRNAIAGAMLMTTKNPTFYNEGALRISAGNFDSRQYAAMYSAPLSKNWAFRIAAEQKTSKSFLDFEAYDAAPNPEEFESSTLRAKLLYQPQDIEGLSNLITINHHDYRGPQGEQLAQPFEDKIADSIQPATFQPEDSSITMETDWAINERYTLENTLVYSDIDVKRTVPTIGRGNVNIDTREILLEPRLLFSANDNVSGFIGLYYFDADQDEFIDIRNNTYKDTIQTSAIFGEASIALSDSLEMILGGRWEEEHRKRVGGTAVPFIVDLDETYSAFLPRASLNWQMNPQWSVGSLISRGFNAGGAGVTFADPFTSYTYDPEYVWNYEIFARSEQLDGRLAFNANLFFADYKDMQLPFNLGSDSNIIRNAEAAETYGLEIGIRWLPVPELQVFTDLGLLKTKITDYTDSGFEGNELPRSPAFSANLGFLYKFNNGFEFGADAHYSQAYFADVDNIQRTEIEPYWVASLQAGYSIGDLRFFAFARNLFDADDVTHYRTIGAVEADDVGYILKPRTWGIGVDVHF